MAKDDFMIPITGEAVETSGSFNYPDMGVHLMKVIDVRPAERDGKRIITKSGDEGIEFVYETKDGKQMTDIVWLTANSIEKRLSFLMKYLGVDTVKRKANPKEAIGNIIWIAVGKEVYLDSSGEPIKKENGYPKEYTRFHGFYPCDKSKKGADKPNIAEDKLIKKKYEEGAPTMASRAEKADVDMTNPETGEDYF